MTRILTGLAAVLAVVLSGQAIYTSGFGLWDPLLHRPLVFGTAILIVTFNLATTHRLEGSAWRWPWARALVDLSIVLVTVAAVYRFITLRTVLEEGIFSLAWYDWALGLAATLATIELTRRLFGWGLPLICGAMMLYTWTGDYLPGFLNHAGYPPIALAESIWFSTTGIFGTPMGVLLSLVLVFIVFGALLEATGAGDVLLRFAFAATGRFRGGPAHAAIAASGLFGTMSGSTIGNVVGTGTFTIPMIKRRGFSAHFAGGVESAASVGGQLIPPVMGAAAFLMADLTGTSYLAIATAALVPGLFYYASLFASVAFEANRLGIEPIAVTDRTRLKRRDWLESLMFIGPILAVVWALIAGRSPAYAGFVAIGVAVALSVINPQIRRDPMRLVSALKRAGESAARVVVVVGAIGVIISLMDLTGLGISFANSIAGLGESSLFLALLLTMLGCLVLGMGMPTLPAYLIIVLVLGPAVSLLGVPLLAIHLFVFYYGVMANITPPVALAAYAAAPIAGADPIRTGITAARLSLVGFIIPFCFIYEPQLLLGQNEFDAAAFLWIAVRLAMAVYLLAACLSGFELARLTLAQRALRLGAVILLLAPADVAVHAIGLVLGCALFTHSLMRQRKNDGAIGSFAAKPMSTLNKEILK